MQRDTTYSPSKPAPYCPDTLSCIRSMAPLFDASEIAANLGWDTERLARVARDHCIEIYGQRPAEEIDHRSGMPARREKRFKPEALAVRSARPVVPDEVSWNIRTRTLTIDQAFVVLSELSANVFDVLLHARGARLTSVEIAESYDRLSDAHNVHHAVSDMRSQLRRLRIDVDARMGTNGGFRLVHLNSSGAIE